MPRDGRGGPADHPLLLTLGALAAVATILGFLLQLGTIQLPAWPFGSGGRDARCGEPALSLSQGSGPSGTAVTVTGTGFAPDQVVTLRFHTEDLGPARTDVDGTFRADVVVPGTFDPFAPRQVDVLATIEGACFARTTYELTR